MDFTIPEEINIMRNTVKRFVEKDLERVSMQVEEEDNIPEEIIQKFRELGLFGMAIPEEYGGLGLPVLGQCICFEEIGKINAAFRSLIGPNNGIGSQGIVLDGTEEQKQKYLAKIASGEYITAFALTEPEAGSDSANLKTTAVPDGDFYALNGKKHFISNGDSAKVVTVMALTDKEKRARGGITAFLVEKGLPGFSVGAIDKKMGYKGAKTCELIFEDCLVPKENIIGGEAMVGKGFVTAMKVLDKGRLTISGYCIGAAQKLLDLSIQYSKERVQFGKPICKNQAIQWMLADSACEIYGARLMVYNGACRADKGEKIGKEAAMCKLTCSEVLGKVADRAMQIFAGAGYMKDLPIERFYRDARLTRIYEGTSEIQRMVIARALLRD